jgi:hypothetical protein
VKWDDFLSGPPQLSDFPNDDDSPEAAAAAVCVSIALSSLTGLIQITIIKNENMKMKISCLLPSSSLVFKQSQHKPFQPNREGKRKAIPFVGILLGGGGRYELNNFQPNSSSSSSDGRHENYVNLIPSKINYQKK